MIEAPFLIGLTQRVEEDARGERRDMLDQRWGGFLEACGIAFVPLPNRLPAVQTLAPLLHGVVLTGGGDLAALGGCSPERDEVEQWLIAEARTGRWPLLGVCRGMQALIHAFGGTIWRTTGHVAVTHAVRGPWGDRTVNSFHDLAATAVPAPLVPMAWADDGVVEAIRHHNRPIAGLMWHPERRPQPDPQDITLVRTLLEVS